jgi:Zn-dependent protease
MLLSLLFNDPLIFLPLIIALLISLTWHEFFHALIASLLGDETAKNAGRLTLNPLAHLDLTGTLLLLLVGFGWGKPVPVNPYNLRNQKWGPALVSVAGPLANLISLIVFSLLFKIIAPASLNPLDIAGVMSVSGNLLLIFLAFLVTYSLVLMVFNLIPVPPLDGAAVLFAFLPARYDNLKFYLEKNGPLILLTILILDGLLGIGIISVLFNFIFGIFARIYNIF